MMSLLAVLLVVPVVTACSHTLTKQKRLIYVASTPLNTLSDGSQSASGTENGTKKASDAESSSGAGDKSTKSGSSSGTVDKSTKSGSSSGAGDKSTKSGSSSGAVDKSTKSGSSSGTGSSASGGDATVVPPTESDIIKLYNDAVLKNASLYGVEFECVNTITANGKPTIYKADVKFNNNYQSPAFDCIYGIEEFYYTPHTGNVFIYIEGSPNRTEIDYNSEDLVKYIMIVDPVLSAAGVNSCNIVSGAGGRVLSMEAVNYADYDGIYKIFSSSGTPLSHIDLEYTITEDGYIVKSRQIFKLSDGEVLEMDKNYINIGSEVNIS